MSFEITERDLKLLYSLYEYRYLNGAQVKQLHFPSQRTADKRLQLLIAAKFLHSFEAPLIDFRVLCLTKKGAELLHDTFGIEPNVPKNMPKDYIFLRHFLAINQFWINIRQACEGSGIFEFLGFISDYKTTQNQKGKFEKYIQDKAGERTHIPDGVFALKKKETGDTALCFLEMDRGTETISAPTHGVFKCLQFYVDYLIEGGYKRYTEDFRCEAFKTARVMFVTTSEKRINNIRKIADTVTDLRAKRMIWLTTEDKAQPDTILKEVWKRLESDDAGFYGFIKTEGV